MHNLFGDTHSVDVRLNDQGEYDIGTPITGDTVAKVLRYVNFEPDNLLRAYQDKFAASNLDQPTQSRLLGELKAGLEGYTYLEE
jgi:arginine decarboxylase